MTLMKIVKINHSLHPHCGAAVNGVGKNLETAVVHLLEVFWSHDLLGTAEKELGEMRLVFPKTVPWPQQGEGLGKSGC